LLKADSLTFFSGSHLVTSWATDADNMAWSPTLPGNCTVVQASMFMMVDSDDNSYADVINRFLDFIGSKKCKSGCPVRGTIYLTSERAITKLLAQINPRFSRMQKSTVQPNVLLTRTEGAWSLIETLCL
jgi:hypothetical protein